MIYMISLLGKEKKNNIAAKWILLAFTFINKP